MVAFGSFHGRFSSHLAENLARPIAGNRLPWTWSFRFPGRHQDASWHCRFIITFFPMRMFAKSSMAYMKTLKNWAAYAVQYVRMLLLAPLRSFSDLFSGRFGYAISGQIETPEGGCCCFSCSQDRVRADMRQTSVVPELVCIQATNCLLLIERALTRFGLCVGFAAEDGQRSIKSGQYRTLPGSQDIMDCRCHNPG